MSCFDQFKTSFFKDLYHLENDIFCIFDVKDYESETVSALCQRAREQVTHGFLFQTSGTTSNKKFVLHDFNAVVSSCESVNAWVKSKSEDRFLAPISIYHMGGFSVLARSYFAQAMKPTILNKWSLEEFIKIVNLESITVTSMVPSQIYEIVQNKIKSPKSLKTVFVGGAALDVDLYTEAKKLGWPLIKTFGSSEACSQIFSDNQLLPHWKVMVDEDQRLQIKGPSLYKGYLFLKESTVSAEAQAKNIIKQTVKFAETPKNDRGYFSTEDMVDIQDHQLISFKGRINDYVKINSTLVHLEVLRKSFYQFCLQHDIDAEKVILSVNEDSKNGLHLVAYTELSLKDLVFKLEVWNHNKPSAHVIRGVYLILQIPRTDLGKVKYAELK